MGGEQLSRSVELLLAAGFACTYVGLVGSIVLEALEAGALTSAANVATFSGFMHFVRIFGGQVGVAVMTRFLSVREQFHSNMLGLHVQAGSWLTDERVRMLTGGLFPVPRGYEEAQYRAIDVLGQQVRGAGLHAGDSRRIRPDHLDGHCVFVADAIPYAGQVHLQDVEEHAMTGTYLYRILLLAHLGVLAAAAQNTAEVWRLTLTDAVHLALTHNRELKIARLKVAETEQKRAQAKASYFPELKNESTFLHTTAFENIGIPAGAFGVFPSVGPVPASDTLIDQGRKTFATSGTMLAQPLTQLIRIHQADRIALSEIAVSRDDLKKAETEVALRVHELYYTILVAQLQKRAAEQQTEFAQTRLRESEQDVRNGDALKIATIEGNAGLLQSKQDALTIDLQLSDLNTQLNDLLGLPLDTSLELSEVQPGILEDRPRGEYERIAWAENPQIQAAAAAVEQAKAGVTAAKSAYIPDITAIARQSYQNGVPFVVHNFGTFGVTLTYDVFDFGKRRAAVREREEKLAVEQENLLRLKEAVSVQVERSYNKAERMKEMLQVANEVVRLRVEGERLAKNQLAQGVELISTLRQASAANYKAQADLLQAQLGYLLANAELEQTIGRTPGL